jgi:hypothetical protein
VLSHIQGKGIRILGKEAIKQAVKEAIAECGRITIENNRKEND